MLTIILLACIVNFLAICALLLRIDELDFKQRTTLQPEPPKPPKVAGFNPELLNGKKYNSNPYTGFDGVNKVIDLVEEQAKRRNK